MTCPSAHEREMADAIVRDLTGNAEDDKVMIATRMMHYRLMLEVYPPRNEQTTQHKGNYAKL